MPLVEINWTPDARTLKNFGFICVVFLMVAGAWIFLRHSFLFFDFVENTAIRAACTLWGIACVFFIASVVYSKAMYPIYLALVTISLPIGFVVSHIAMAFLYYCIFTPFGVVFKIMKRDVLERKFESDRQSYWVKRNRETDRQRYFRQY